MTGGINVSVNYNKMWKLIEFSQLHKCEFQNLISVSDPTMSKLSKNEPVSMDVMLRICKALHCDIGDVMEVHNDV